MQATLVSPVADQLATLGLVLGATGPLNAVNLHISTSNISPTRDTLIGAFTPATFTGSAAKVAIVFGTEYVDPLTGSVVALSATETFIATAVAAPETIFSFFLTDSTNAIYHGGGRVVPPVPITAVHDGLSLEVLVPYGY